MHLAAQFRHLEAVLGLSLGSDDRLSDTAVRQVLAESTARARRLITVVRLTTLATTKAVALLIADAARPGAADLLLAQSDVRGAFNAWAGAADQQLPATSWLIADKSDALALARLAKAAAKEAPGDVRMDVAAQVVAGLKTAARQRLVPAVIAKLEAAAGEAASRKKKQNGAWAKELAAMAPKSRKAAIALAAAIVITGNSTDQLAAAIATIKKWVRTRDDDDDAEDDGDDDAEEDSDDDGDDDADGGDEDGGADGDEDGDDETGGIEMLRAAGRALRSGAKQGDDAAMIVSWVSRADAHLRALRQEWGVEAMLTKKAKAAKGSRRPSNKITNLGALVQFIVRSPLDAHKAFGLASFHAYNPTAAVRVTTTTLAALMQKWTKSGCERWDKVVAAAGTTRLSARFGSPLATAVIWAAAFPGRYLLAQRAPQLSRPALESATLAQLDDWAATWRGGWWYEWLAKSELQHVKRARWTLLPAPRKAPKGLDASDVSKQKKPAASMDADAAANKKKEASPAALRHQRLVGTLFGERAQQDRGDGTPSEHAKWKPAATFAGTIQLSEAALNVVVRKSVDRVAAKFLGEKGLRQVETVADFWAQLDHGAGTTAWEQSLRRWLGDRAGRAADAKLALQRQLFDEGRVLLAVDPGQIKVIEVVAVAANEERDGFVVQRWSASTSGFYEWTGQRRWQVEQTCRGGDGDDDTRRATEVADAALHHHAALGAWSREEEMPKVSLAAEQQHILVEQPGAARDVIWRRRVARGRDSWRHWILARLEALAAAMRPSWAPAESRVRPLLAWGNGQWQARHGRAPSPHSALRQWLARHLPMVVVGEKNSSKLSPCCRQDWTSSTRGRVRQCPTHKHSLDRDVGGAANIAALALELLAGNKRPAAFA